MRRGTTTAALVALAASALAASAQSAVGSSSSSGSSPSGFSSGSTTDATAASSPDPSATNPDAATPKPTTMAMVVDASGGGDAWASASASGSGSGSGWLDAGWDGDAGGWSDDALSLWAFEPAWGWETPYPPNGTTYRGERELGARRAFHFAPSRGVALTGAQVVAQGGRANCSGASWCVHVTFHSSYGLLTDMDAFVLDRYESLELLDGATFARATRSRDPTAPDAPSQPMPLLLGGWTPQELALARSSPDDVKTRLQRFNETRRTTWTLFPRSGRLDVELSLKQLFTLLPGYRPGPASSLNGSRVAATDALEADWGPSDHVLLRLTAELRAAGASSAMLPRVLNFTGSELLELDYFSSLVFPDDGGDDEDLSGALTNELALDVVLGRRRYGSGIPWNPARPSDACAACDAMVLRHERVARCLADHVPRERMWALYDSTRRSDDDADDDADAANGSYALDHVVDACFGLPWLLHGVENGFDEFASSSSSSSSSSGSFWSGSVLDDMKAASSSGSAFGRNADADAGDVDQLDGFVDALRLTRDADAGIRCFVAHQCPVGERYSASAAGRVVVLDHQPAAAAVTSRKPSFSFHLTLRLPGSDDEFTTSELWSDSTETELAHRVAAALPNASDFHLAVAVRLVNNSKLLQLWDEWQADPTAEPPVVDSGWGSDDGWSAGSDLDAPVAGDADTGSMGTGSMGTGSMDNGDMGSGSMGSMGSGSMGTGGMGSGSMGTGSAGSGVAAARRLESVLPEARPEPAFTVEITFRNVSVAPQVTSVTWGPQTAVENSSLATQPSQLRLKLAPLNLTQYQYVPPPDHVDLSWNEEAVDDVDDGNADDGGDGDANNTSGDWAWQICSQCQDVYNTCESSTGCRAGVRAFLRETLDPKNFAYMEGQLDAGSYDDDVEGSRRRFGVDVAFRLRQSAGYFTADGYDVFMNVLTCLSTAQASCDLDVQREVHRMEDGSVLAASPTKLDIVPSRVVFELSPTADGNAEAVAMSYRDKEHVFLWPSSTGGLDIDAFHDFVWDIMTSFDVVEAAWGRSPSPGWIGIYYHQYTKEDSVTGEAIPTYSFEIMFKNGFFLAAEPPRFKPAAAENYDELERSHWQAVISAYRDPEGESFWDDGAPVTWPRLAYWLNELGSDADFLQRFYYTDLNAWELPICRECVDKLNECYQSDGCRSAIRDSVLPTLTAKRRDEYLQFHVEFSAEVAAWRLESDPEVFNQVLGLFACLTRASCPVGYVRPAERTASLLPTRIGASVVFWVTAPMGTEVEMVLDGSYATFTVSNSSTTLLEDELRGLLYSKLTHYDDYGLYVSVELDTSSVNYRVGNYPVWAPIPTFTLLSNMTQLDVPMHTQADLYLLSEAVEAGAMIAWDLLNLWFATSDSGTSGDWGGSYGDSGSSGGSNVMAELCPSCVTTMERCQADDDCVTSSRDVLAPMLRQASWNYSTEPTADDRTRVSVDLAPLLLSLKDAAFTSREAWSAFAAELYCIAAHGCELEAGYYNELEGKYDEPTYLDVVGSTATVLRFRMYNDSAVTMWLNGLEHTYTPVDDISLEEAMDNFRYWIMDVVYQEPYFLEMDSQFEPMEIVDAELGLASMGMALYSVMDNREPVYSLVNPKWMPTGKIVGGRGLDTASGLPTPQVNVTPWAAKLWSVDRAPNVGRLLDLLEFDGATGSASGSAWWGGSSSGQGSDAGFCSSCAEQRHSCYSDDDCYNALVNSLLPLLQNMAVDAVAADPTDTLTYEYDMTGQILDGVLMQMSTLQGRQMLVNLLTCSSDTSCVQTSSDLKTTGGYANLEISPASSTFSVGVGQEMTIYDLSGSPFTYYDDGDAGALDDFIEMTMLGGIDVSGIKVVSSISEVTADDHRAYTVVYYGAMGFALPHFERGDVDTADFVASSESTMQFRFVAPTHELAVAYSVWFDWLATADTSSSLSLSFSSGGSAMADSLAGSSFSSGGSTTTSDSLAGSGSSFTCAECEAQLQACVSDSECVVALVDYAVPMLSSLSSESLETPFVFDATATFLDGVFPTFTASESRAQLLALLSCSAAASCVQLSADVGSPGVVAGLDIAPASSVFVSDVGSDVAISTELGDTYTYTFDGDVATLATFIQDAVLGAGEAVTGVLVDVAILDESIAPASYSVTYHGFTGWTTPHVSTPVGESEDSSMQLVFTADAPDLLGALSPWLQWLSGGATV